MADVWCTDKNKEYFKDYLDTWCISGDDRVRDYKPFLWAVVYLVVFAIMLIQRKLFTMAGHKIERTVNIKTNENDQATYCIFSLI